MILLLTFGNVNFTTNKGEIDIMVKDTKIYLVTYTEKDKNNKTQLYVSHGIGNNSGKVHVLPQEPLDTFSFKRDNIGGRYI